MPILQRTGAIRLNKDNASWYGTHNEKDVEPLKQFKISACTWEKSNPLPKALLVFGRHVDLDPIYYKSALQKLSRSYNLMLIRVKDETELDTWLQNVQAHSSRRVQLIFFNVHGNQVKNKFSFCGTKGEVGHQRTLALRMRFILESQARICFSGCHLGNEETFFHPSVGLQIVPCFARRVSWEVPDTAILAPMRNVTANCFNFNEHSRAIAFKDGKHNITRFCKEKSLPKTTKEDMERWLPYPEHIEKVLKESLPELTVEDYVELVKLGGQKGWIVSAIHLLQKIPKQDREELLLRTFLGLPMPLSEAFGMTTKSVYQLAKASAKEDVLDIPSLLQIFEGNKQDVSKQLLAACERGDKNLIEAYLGKILSEGIEIQEKEIKAVFTFSTENNESVLCYKLFCILVSSDKYEIFLEPFISELISQNKEILGNRHISGLLRNMIALKRVGHGMALFPYCTHFKFTVSTKHLDKWVSLLMAQHNKEAYQKIKPLLQTNDVYRKILNKAEAFFNVPCDSSAETK